MKPVQGASRRQLRRMVREELRAMLARSVRQPGNRLVSPAGLVFDVQRLLRNFEKGMES